MEVLTTAEAAKRLDTYPRDVQRMVQRGQLTPVKRTTAGFLFDAADVDALAASSAA